MSKNLLERTLNLTFRTQERRQIALQILETVKRRERTNNPFKATEREDFCRQNNISLTKYDNILMCLKSGGLVKKEGNYLFLDDEFVFGLLNEWIEFLK